MSDLTIWLWVIMLTGLPLLALIVIVMVWYVKLTMLIPPHRQVALDDKK